MNRDGLLSATLYPLLVLFGTLGLCYLVLGIIWLVLTIVHRHELLQLQIWIAVVIAIGMSHMSFAFGDAEYYNNNGVRLKFLMVVAQLLLVAKNTLARLLILVVSMGFGVLKPRIDSSFTPLGLFAGLYFIFDIVYSINRGINQATDTSETTPEVFAALMLAILDTVFCLWVFNSLARTMAVLRVRRNAVKLQMYQRFRMMLTICVVAATAVLMWMVVDKVQGSPDWRNQWLKDGFWHILFFVILVSISVLWRPTNNNARFAYSPLETIDESENVVTPNFASDTLKMRNINRQDSREDHSGDIATTSFGGGSDMLHTLMMDSEEEILFTRTETSKLQ